MLFAIPLPDHKGSRAFQSYVWVLEREGPQACCTVKITLMLLDCAQLTAKQK